MNNLSTDSKSTTYDPSVEAYRFFGELVVSRLIAMDKRFLQVQNMNDSTGNVLHGDIATALGIYAHRVVTFNKE
jgi:hypothetical protein